jgi:hypothetical protein
MPLGIIGVLFCLSAGKPEDDQDEDQDHLDQAFQEDYHV